MYTLSQRLRDQIIQLAEIYRVQTPDLVGFISEVLRTATNAGELAILNTPGNGPYEVIPFFDGYCIVKHKQPPKMPAETDVYYMPESREESEAECIAVASVLNTLWNAHQSPASFQN